MEYQEQSRITKEWLDNNLAFILQKCNLAYNTHYHDIRQTVWLKVLPIMQEKPVEYTKGYRGRAKVKRIMKPNDSSNYKQWLCSILHNTVIDECRKIIRHKNRYQDMYWFSVNWTNPFYT